MQLASPNISTAKKNMTLLSQPRIANEKEAGISTLSVVFVVFILHRGTLTLWEELLFDFHSNLLA